MASAATGDSTISSVAPASPDALHAGVRSAGKDRGLVVPGLTVTARYNSGYEAGDLVWPLSRTLAIFARSFSAVNGLAT